MSRRTLRLALLTTTLLSLAAAAHAAAPAAPAPAQDDFLSALTNGTPYWQERYRFEDVKQSNLTNNANANTLRSIVGYKTGVYQNFQVDLAVINVAQFGQHEYNDGSDNKTSYPTIGDPADTDILHGSLAYTGLPQTTLVGGRQEIALDNQRWVGAPAWRQVIQTFDGVTATNKSVDNLELFYGHLFHQNRAQGANVTNGVYEGSDDLFHAAYSGLKNVKLVGYSYLTDNDNFHALSSATTGARVEASVPLDGAWKATGNLEYARQVNYGNNPDSFGLNYYLIEPGAAYKGISGRVGYEVLEGNGTDAVQSPMMAEHPMNGWADTFAALPAATPLTGLHDSYANISYKFQIPYKYLDSSLTQVQVHSYSADQVSEYYGNELDLDFTQNIAKHYAVEAQFADYVNDKLTAAQAGTSVHDTRKFMLMVTMNY